MEGVCFTPILEEKLSQVRNFKMKMLLTTPEAKQAREAAFAENKGLGTRSTKTRGVISRRRSLSVGADVESDSSSAFAVVRSRGPAFRRGVE